MDASEDFKIHEYFKSNPSTVLNCELDFKSYELHDL